MIEVICIDGHSLVARAEADDPESALTAARTLWDDSFRGTQGQKLSLTFHVAGQHVQTMSMRP